MRAMIRLNHLDHLVLTVASLERTCEFYTRVLGMGITVFGAGRKALSFGVQRINLHEVGHEFEPKARTPTPGSADLCFICVTPLESVIAHLQHCGVSVEEGPVERTGALGTLRSVYIRDPDHNLIELSEPL